MFYQFMKIRTNLYVCEICGKRFSQNHKIKIHVTSVHENNKPFKCEICDYSFSQKITMKKHVTLVHEEKKPIKRTIVA